jgi:hypothetical protein
VLTQAVCVLVALGIQRLHLHDNLSFAQLNLLVHGQQAAALLLKI